MTVGWHWLAGTLTIWRKCGWGDERSQSNPFLPHFLWAGNRIGGLDGLQQSLRGAAPSSFHHNIDTDAQHLLWGTETHVILCLWVCTGDLSGRWEGLPVRTHISCSRRFLSGSPTDSPALSQIELHIMTCSIRNLRSTPSVISTLFPAFPRFRAHVGVCNYLSAPVEYLKYIFLYWPLSSCCKSQRYSSFYVKACEYMGFSPTWILLFLFLWPCNQYLL